MTPETTVHKTEIVPADAPRYLADIPIYDDLDALAERTISRTMAAETPEQLLADPEAGGLRDHVGELLTITGVLGIAPSTLKTGGYYIIFEATERDGSILTLTTGSPYAASRIAVLHHKGWLPRTVRVVELESASNPGQSSLWIVDPSPGQLAAFQENF